MPFTSESNKKLAEQIKAKYGVDENGKSLHHKRAGAAGGRVGAGHFRELTKTPEGRVQLREISRRGAVASNKVQGKGAGKNPKNATESEIT